MVISTFQCRFSSFVRGDVPGATDERTRMGTNRGRVIARGYAVGKNGKCQSEGMSTRVTSLPPPLVAATPYCRLHGTLFFSAGQPSYPHRTLPALLSALPWVPDHGLGWNLNYWDHKIEYGTYGTHGIGAYGIYVVVCLCGVLLSCENLRHRSKKKIRLLRIKQSDVRFSNMNENETRSDQ